MTDRPPRISKFYSQSIMTSGPLTCKDNYQTFHFCYTPATPDKTNLSVYKINRNQFLKPTRHASLNYEKRDKYVSHCNSYILKKVYRINQNEDHNLQFLSRTLACENDIYDKDEMNGDASLSPLSGKISLKNNSSEKKPSKSSFYNGTHNNNNNNKSPFTFRLTRIENFKLKNCLQEMEFEEEVIKGDSNDQSEKDEFMSPDIDERKLILKMQGETEEKKNNMLEMEELNRSRKKSKDTPLSTVSSAKERRILEFLEKERVIWIPNVEIKKEKIIVKKEPNCKALNLKSDLLKRRNFKNLKVNLSSSCDDLTAMVNAGMEEGNA